MIYNAKLEQEGFIWSLKQEKKIIGNVIHLRRWGNRSNERDDPISDV